MARWRLGLVVALVTVGCRPEPGFRDSDWQDETEETSSACERWVGHAEDAADASGLDVALIMGVMRAESSFREGAESPVGAVGLMQVMPSTGDHFGCDDLYVGEENIRCGAKVLADYVRRVDGDLDYGLAAYNAGLANAQRWRKSGTAPANLDYVRHVLRYADQYRNGGCESFGPGFKAWEADGKSRLHVTDE